MCYNHPNQLLLLNLLFLVGHIGYDTQNQNNLASGGASSGGNVYPSLPKGDTTPRPNVYQPAVGGSGYQGGAIGSGYPGSGNRANTAQAGGYPQQAGGYPQQTGGYPQYPGYTQGGSRNGYPQQGYYPGSQGGYQQGEVATITILVLLVFEGLYS